MTGVLYTDGGARGNPGPAAIGYVLILDGDSRVTHAEYIGETTNNQAEYTALLHGLERAHAEGVEELSCYLDSELLVRQLSGAYRVRDAKLKPLFDRVTALRESFASVTFHHVMRDNNTEADRLVNEALDRHAGRRRAKL